MQMICLRSSWRARWVWFLLKQSGLAWCNMRKIDFQILCCTCLNFLALISLFHVENATHLLFQGGWKKNYELCANLPPRLSRRDIYHRFNILQLVYKKKNITLTPYHCSLLWYNWANPLGYFDSERYICGSSVLCLKKNSKPHAVAFNKTAQELRQQS